MTDKRYRFVKLFIVFLVVTAFAGLVYYLYLTFKYTYIMPQAPQPNTSRVLPLNVSHGWIVYVTDRELRHYRMVEDLFSFGFPICFFAAVFLNMKYKLFSCGRRALSKPNT